MKLYKLSDPVTPEELEAAYKGQCRNASKAMWVEKIKKFVYIRSKFGSELLETINHPANDNGFDLFLATKETIELTESEKEKFEGIKNIVEMDRLNG